MRTTDCPHHSATMIRSYPEDGYSIYRCDRCLDKWTEDDAR